MKRLNILFPLAVFIITNTLCFSQTTNTDTTKAKPTQFRRGVEISNNYQSYEQKYAGKNLSEEKRRMYPLGYSGRKLTNKLSKITTTTGTWAELNPKVPRVDYLGIHFINPDTGWACGDLGTIIKTTDGGKKWTVEETNTPTPVLKVNSFNGKIVIAAGYNGLILRSTNGGESWTEVTSGVTGDLWGLQMLNDTLGWSCGNRNSLIKTTDGGESWQKVLTPGYTSDYWWIDFLPAPSWNKDYGFIAANGKVLRTTDGGTDWDIIQAGDSYPLFSINVIDSLHIAAAGYGGTSYRGKNIYSSDGGNTWITGGLTTFDPINCIKYVNPDTGYIAMSEVGIWKTTNRGADWKIITGVINNIGEYELQLFPKEQTGYSAGSGLKISKTERGLDSWYKLVLNESFADVYFTSKEIGYIASSSVYKTTDSGNNWFMLSSFPTNVFISSLNRITFIDSVTGFAGGPPCRIVKTADAGNSWYVTNVFGLADTIGSINKIFFINHTTGWAVTSRGGIIKTTDSGENWFAQLNAGISIIFNSIYFVDSLYGWTTNGNSRPYKTTDGGKNWIEQSDLDIWESKDVYFLNIDTGWLIDDFNLNLYKTTNSGLDWSIQLNSKYIIKTFGWLSKSHGLIIGDGIYETVDTGNTWNEILDLRNIGLRKLQSPSPYAAYSIGKVGLIYKYTDTTITPVELVSFNGKYNGSKVELTWETATEINNYGFDIQRRKTGWLAGEGITQTEWEKIGFVKGNGTTTKQNSYLFIDNNVETCKYYYRLKQIDYDGSFEYSNEIEVDINFPSEFSLSQNFPNPFNPETNINYSIPEETNVTIKLYDVIGREVKVLVNERKQPGKYTIKFKGGEISSGVYFYRLTTISGYTAVKKLIILK